MPARLGVSALSATIAMRPSDPRDEPFLRALWLESRPELAVLPEALVELQLTAQRQHYERLHPMSVDEVVELDGRRVGRCWTAESEDGLHLLDLAVSASRRRRGIGRAVLDVLAGRAAVHARPVHLAVWAANADARRLYAAYGFEERGTSGGHVLMSLVPGGAA